MDGPPVPDHGGNEGTAWCCSEEQYGDGSWGLHASQSLPATSSLFGGAEGMIGRLYDF